MRALKKDPTCVENYRSPSYLDIDGFERTLTPEIGLSSFNKLRATVLKF